MGGEFRDVHENQEQAVHIKKRGLESEQEVKIKTLRIWTNLVEGTNKREVTLGHTNNTNEEISSNIPVSPKKE